MVTAHEWGALVAVGSVASGAHHLRALCGGTSDRVPRRERPSARARPTLNHVGHDQIDPRGSRAATALPVVAARKENTDFLLALIHKKRIRS